MSFSEQLKKTKKAVITTALAVAAAVAPIKGQSQEAKPEAESDKTVEVSKAQKERQQMIEKAIKSGAPKEEIAKYIDFPEFIPTTKDGQFDQKKADEWAKKLAPYMKTLAEKGQSVSAAEAYKAFKESTGQKDVSLQDFEQVCKMAQEAMKGNKDKKSDIGAYVFMALAAAGIALVSGKFAYSIGKEGVKEYTRFRSIGTAAFDLGIAAFPAVISLFMAGGSVASSKEAIDGFKSTPERETCRIYSRMYDTHVDNVVKDQQQKFQQLEWAEAKQLIQNVQGRK